MGDANGYPTLNVHNLNRLFKGGHDHVSFTYYANGVPTTLRVLKKDTGGRVLVEIPQHPHDAHLRKHAKEKLWLNAW